MPYLSAPIHLRPRRTEPLRSISTKPHTPPNVVPPPFHAPAFTRHSCRHAWNTYTTRPRKYPLICSPQAHIRTLSLRRVFLQANNSTTVSLFLILAHLLILCLLALSQPTVIYTASNASFQVSGLAHRRRANSEYLLKSAIPSSLLVASLLLRAASHPLPA